MASKKEQARLVAEQRREERRQQRYLAARQEDRALVEKGQKRRDAEMLQLAKRTGIKRQHMATRFEAEVAKRIARALEVTLPSDKPITFDSFNQVSMLPVMMGSAFFGVARLEDVLAFCHRPVDFAGSAVFRILARIENRYPGKKVALIARFAGTTEDMVLTNWNLLLHRVCKDDAWMRCCVNGKTYVLQTLPRFIARLKREETIRR